MDENDQIIGTHFSLRLSVYKHTFDIFQKEFWEKCWPKSEHPIPYQKFRTFTEFLNYYKPSNFTVEERYDEKRYFCYWKPPNKSYIRDICRPGEVW